MTPDVVLMATYQAAEIEAALAGIPELNAIKCDTVAQACAAIGAGAEVIVGAYWHNSLLMPGLKWYQAVSSGTEFLPVSMLADRGVVVTSARGVHPPAMADHVFGMLLALTRGIADAVRNAQLRRWQPQVGLELGDLTMGILGLGAVGETIARRAKAWDMRVIGTTLEPLTYRGAADAVFGPGETLRICQDADVVVVALPVSDGTRGLVGSEELSALRGGYLINVGRGPVVNEQALVASLKNGELRGACLDVYAVEPLPEESELWSLPNVIVSPHMASLSPNYGRRLGAIVSQNLRAFLGHAEWINRVA